MNSDLPGRLRVEGRRQQFPLTYQHRFARYRRQYPDRRTSPHKPRRPDEMGQRWRRFPQRGEINGGTERLGLWSPSVTGESAIEYAKSPLAGRGHSPQEDRAHAGAEGGQAFPERLFQGLPPAIEVKETS